MKNLSLTSLAVSKIFAGGFSKPGELPHLVALRTKASNTHFCGASIIHPYLLLCAAHCFTNQRAPFIQIVAGEHDRMKSDGNREQVRDVTLVDTHEKYDNVTWVNDIAILVLNESLEFNDYVKPIKLREPDWNLPGLNFPKYSHPFGNAKLFFYHNF